MGIKNLDDAVKRAKHAYAQRHRLCSASRVGVVATDEDRMMIKLQYMDGPIETYVYPDWTCIRRIGRRKKDSNYERPRRIEGEKIKIEDTNRDLFAKNTYLTQHAESLTARIKRLEDALRIWDEAFATGRNEPLYIARDAARAVLENN